MGLNRPSIPRSPRTAQGAGLRDVNDMSIPRDGLADERNNRRSAIHDFMEGTVIHAFPYLHTYMVQVSTSSLKIICTALAGSSLDPLSGMECSMYAPLTRVLVFRPPWMQLGIIMGAIPSPQTDSEAQLPDFLVDVKGAGFRKDHCHVVPITTPGVGAINCGEGRAADVLPGDIAWINELGCGLIVGKLLASIRGGDLSRLDMFYVDELVRLFSYNLEHFAAGYERRICDDEGEIVEEELRTPYPWEAAGLLVPGQAMRDGEYEWAPGTEEGPREPHSPSQDGIWRHKIYRGYLGDLHHEYISAPSPDGRYPQDPQSSQSDKPNLDMGLFEEVRGIDGGYRLASAKHIIFVKRALIPVPVRRRLPHDPAGDSPHVVPERGQLNADGYNAAGYWHEPGKSHVKDEFKWADGQPGAEEGSPGQEAAQGAAERYPAIRGSQLTDMHTYLSNWYELVPMARHEKDFYLPQVEELSLGTMGGEEQPPLPDLSTSFQATLPPSVQVEIDHRAAAVEYFKSMGIFAMLDDGSIVLSDGYGSQIKMGGGNIEITCPGDVILRPGRNVTAMAPRDVILRAGNSIDATAALGDVRLKAERNMQLLSGNGGQGGTLIENRSTTVTQDYQDKLGEEITGSGVVIKAENSRYLVYAQDIYLKTMGGFAGIDASGGPLFLSAQSVLAGVQTDFIVAAGADLADPGRPLARHVLGADIAVLDSRAIVRGTCFVAAPVGRADMIVDGNVVCTGHYGAGTLQFVIGGLSDTSREEISRRKDEVAGFSKRLTEIIDNTRDSLYGEDKTAPANAELIDRIRVSLRTDAQYGHEDDNSFMLAEAPWQQRQRQDDADITWEEPPVTVGDEDTYPYPGKANWTEKLRYATVESNFYDDLLRVAHNRPYAKPEQKAPTMRALDLSYVISTQGPRSTQA